MNLINDTLLNSWLRSEQYEASIDKAKEAILEAHELHMIQDKHTKFLKRLQPTVEGLASRLIPSRSVVVLSSPEGVLLNTVGDSVYLKETEKIFLQPGAQWSEAIHGTNSAGTVAIEKRPIEVVASDHYLETHHKIYCVGAPIFNSQGKLEGVMNVSGHKHHYRPSLLGFVDTIARMVENDLLFEAHQADIILSLQNKSLSSYEALIAIDSDGEIRGFNRAARELLPLEQAKEATIHLSELCLEPNEILDQTISSTLSFNIVDIETASYKQSFIASIQHRPPTSRIFTNHPVKQVTYPERIESADQIFPNIIGRDPVFLRALETAKKVAKTNYPISITGESGTGKDLLSYAIHQASDRKDQPFIALNCGGLTKSLIESELFGYEAGAFTGAKKEGHAGVFERAHKGSLFLDEIAELPLDVQAMLLRVLQDFKVRRIAGHSEIQVDVRIITATHTDLWEKVQAGSFREDLFYRLQGVNIQLPALRERRDRQDYACHFLKEIQEELKLESLQFSQSALDLINHYPWPGNLRQLKSALREAAFLAGDGRIDRQHFPAYILQSTIALEETNSLLEDVENRTIVETLKRTKGNVSEAARILGIGRNTLYRKMEKIRHLLHE